MKKHNLSNTRIYGVWEGMVSRTQNPNNRAYKWYGGRGIKLYEDWKTFINFYNWAMSSGYKDELTIDRIDNDGNYEPGNCRWVTYTENRKNVGRKRNKKPDWGVINTKYGYATQIWNKQTQKLDRFGLFKTKEEAITARDLFLEGRIKPKVKRLDYGIYASRWGYIVHVVHKKKCYHVGTYKDKTEAIKQRDAFRELLLSEKTEYMTVLI